MRISKSEYKNGKVNWRNLDRYTKEELEKLRKEFDKRGYENERI